MSADPSIRPVDVKSASDIEAALAVVTACELNGVGWTDATRESVESQLDGPDSLVEAHLLAFDGDEPIGLLTAEIDRHGREIFLDAFAIGESAAQLQRLLLERGIATAVRVAAAAPAPPVPLPVDPFELSPGIWQVVSGAYEQDAEYRAVLTDLGMRTIRRFWRMILDVTGGSADAPPAPPGVTKRVVDGDDDRRAMHALFCESFADHFGSSHDRPYGDWIASVEGLAGSDPSRWWLALLHGQPVGICLLDDSKVEFGEGHVRTLGIIESARGRGIARWLLNCAAADCAARGHDGLSLSVDGQNTTGATALYTSVGFTTRQVIDVWSYPLLGSGSEREE